MRTCRLTLESPRARERVPKHARLEIFSLSVGGNVEPMSVTKYYKIARNVREDIIS